MSRRKGPQDPYTHRVDSGAPSRQKRVRKWSDERYAGDAPGLLSVEEKRAWAAGWNAAAREARLAAGGGRYAQEELAERDRLEGDRRPCPDGGTCHHGCGRDGGCWRVFNTSPLSDVFPEDEWPEDLVAAEARYPMRGTI